jgi:hypothetical protein
MTGTEVACVLAVAGEGEGVVAGTGWLEVET